MADISDVEKALVGHLAADLISGPYTPMTVAASRVAVDGQPVPVRIMRGWPISDALNADLKAGVCTITVLPEPGMTRQAPRFSGKPQVTITPDLDLISAVSGRTVTFAGTADDGVLAGIGVGNVGYGVRVTGTANAAAVAASLAADIPGASAAGAVVTVPGSEPLKAAVAATSMVRKTVGRTYQCFKITILAPNPQVRDAIGSEISGLMADTRRVALADGGHTGVPSLRGLWTDDAPQKVGTWTRTERYEIEYSTIRTRFQPGILFIGLNTNVNVLAGQFHPDGPIEI